MSLEHGGFRGQTLLLEYFSPYLKFGRVRNPSFFLCPSTVLSYNKSLVHGQIFFPTSRDFGEWVSSRNGSSRWWRGVALPCKWRLILVPRGRAPFGQQEEWRPLALGRPNFLNTRTVIVSYSQPIRFLRFGSEHAREAESSGIEAFRC